MSPTNSYSKCSDITKMAENTPGYFSKCLVNFLSVFDAFMQAMLLLKNDCRVNLLVHCATTAV